jgi:hypothetical protein
MHEGGYFFTIIMKVSKVTTDAICSIDKQGVEMMNEPSFAIVWILAASLLGFGISAVFSSWLKLPRRVFLIPYIVLTSAFLFWFSRTMEIYLPVLLIENWIEGLIAGIIVGAFLVINVRSQPYSRQATGGNLLFDIAWLGLAYGIVDALYLNVMPVLAVSIGLSRVGWVTSWPGKIAFGILALAASLLVTFAYHVGYSEYRNKSVGLVLVGNTLITLAYVLSASPLGAVLGHTVMHVAATVQGPETTIQLPPHHKDINYSRKQSVFD